MELELIFNHAAHHQGAECVLQIFITIFSPKGLSDSSSEESVVFQSCSVRSLNIDAFASTQMVSAAFSNVKDFSDCVWQVEGNLLHLRGLKVIWKEQEVGTSAASAADEQRGGAFQGWIRMALVFPHLLFQDKYHLRHHSHELNLVHLMPHQTVNHFCGALTHPPTYTLWINKKHSEQLTPSNTWYCTHTPARTLPHNTAHTPTWHGNNYTNRRELPRVPLLSGVISLRITGT